MVERRARPGHALLALLLALALGVLGACGGDDPPVADPPEPTGSSGSASPSGTTTSSPSKTLSPSLSREEAFVRDWVDVHNQMLATGDTSAFRELSTSDCASCATLAESIEKIYGDDGRVEGGRLVNFRGFASSGSFDGDPKFDFTVRTLPTKVYDKSGGVSQTFTGQRKQTFNITLRGDNGTFKVARLGRYE